MRWITYQSERGPRLAGVKDNLWVDVGDLQADFPADIKSFLELPATVQAAISESVSSAESGFSADSSKLLAPISNPEKVICIGLNYLDHAKESGVEPPKEPIVFSKFPSTIIGPEAPILLPAASEEVDFEAELVVVIGKKTKHVFEEEALASVAGYCCGHDVSARDWQLRKNNKQWLLGKTFDTFAPIGPELVTADEIPDPGKLAIKLHLNGETQQSSTTAQMIFSVPQLIAYLSRLFTLVTGDLIFTGTPPGVGMAQKPPRYLKPGDVAEVEIEGLGTLRNPVATEPIAS
ncbi:Fumarylacetoacetate hydrolase domain-containing protein 2 [Planctomycetales bacterium 10988]|nr:Fumarylacetoacetate hydrolase domain-containing protein 2 [Planctomycetales bacterium 10988]